MPPTRLFELTDLDLQKVEFDRQAIGEVNPQSFEMSQLDAVIWHDLASDAVFGVQRCDRQGILGSRSYPRTAYYAGRYYGGSGGSIVQFLYETHLRT